MTDRDAQRTSFAPLAGVRIVSLALNLPGPLAAARLVDLGAKVTKVEPPRGDPLAQAAPSWYKELVRDQQVVTLDLKQQEGPDRLLHEMLTDADVLLTAMRPSALRRLNLASLTDSHPALVHVEIVGHADDQAEAPGHDLTYQAEHGTLQPPTMPLVPMADLLGAERAVSATLAALLARRSAHHGGRHRVALDEAAHDAGAAVRHGLTGTEAPLGGTLPTYRIYPSADGHIALGALEPHFAARVHEHLGRTVDELEATFAGTSTAQWEQLARQLDIPLVGIKTPAREARDHS